MGQGIFDDIGEELSQEFAVTTEEATVLDVDLEQMPAILCHAGIDSSQFLDDSRRIDNLEICPPRTALDLGNTQQRIECIDNCVDFFQSRIDRRLRLAHCSWISLQHLKPLAQPADWRPQVMGYIARNLLEALH